MKPTLTYLVLTFGLSTPGYFLIIGSGRITSVTVLYLMWCPGLSGILTACLYDHGLKGFGWGIGQFRWIAVAYLLPFLYAGFGYGAIWLVGLGGINPEYQFHFSRLVLLGPLLSLVSATGEEIGWRGFLAPQLYRHLDFTSTSLLTGTIWALWHFPGIIAGLYLTRMPMVPQLALFVVALTAMTFGMNWLRFKSGSLWTAALFHASHNFYVQQLFDPLTRETGPLSKYMLGEAGIALTLIFLGLAFASWRLRDRLPGGGRGCPSKP
jgi:membrane protease YdiL (CAAX protease family)